MANLNSNNKMCIFDLYFYIWTKDNVAPEERGIFFGGVIGYSFPLMFALILMSEAYEVFFPQLFLTYGYPSLPLILLVWVVILIFIYFYYKHNNRGEKIMDYYDKTKLNKWYYILLLHIVYLVAYLSISILIYYALEKIRR